MPLWMAVTNSESLTPSLKQKFNYRSRQMVNYSIVSLVCYRMCVLLCLCLRLVQVFWCVKQPIVYRADRAAQSH